MNTLLIIINIGLLAAICILIALFLQFKKNSEGKNDTGEFERLQQSIQSQAQFQTQQMQGTINLVLQQLARQQEATDRSSQMMGSRLENTTKVVSDVQGKLVQLEEANKRLLEIGKDISGLQSILQAPKLRGTMGEIWLKDLISQMIPKEHYQMQYRFKNGEICDAIIKLRDSLILPIDSKFSLENFIKMVGVEGPEQEAYKKLFASDIKKRVDEISNKYIKPGEGTLDFAFMYIPAENVYYQAFIQSEDNLQLLSYAFKKKVIPVSPSSFYAYLQVILFGLKGMEIEKSALDIQKNLNGLQVKFARFRDDYGKVGHHLKNAQNAYEISDKKIDHIDSQFEQIFEKEKTLLEEPNQ